MTGSLVVNCSTVLKGLPVEEQLREVSAAGFGAVEFWWPFRTATPDAAEVSAFVDAIRESGLALVGLNLYSGDMSRGDRGVLSLPGGERELHASAEIAAEIGHRLGVHRFNALYGNRLGARRIHADAQDEIALANLIHISRILGEIDGTILLEPLSGAASYPLRTAEDVLHVLFRGRERGVENAGLLLDVYHLAVNGDDVGAVIAHSLRHIAHVQVADAPGRGAPGSGDLPLLDWMTALRVGGYEGAIALEYMNGGAGAFGRIDRVAWGEVE